MRLRCVLFDDLIVLLAGMTLELLTLDAATWAPNTSILGTRQLGSRCDILLLGRDPLWLSHLGRTRSLLTQQHT